MSDSRCDHYWLVRRGGTCRYCGDTFPGQFGPSDYELREKAKAPDMKALLESFSAQAKEQGFFAVADMLQEEAKKQK